MKLDVHTPFLLTMYVEAILGLLLLLAWVQRLGTRAMAWWGGAHLLRCMSIAVYGMYGVLPNFVTIELAGALLFTSYGIIWAGARVFNRRPVGPGLLLAGAVAWMAACRTPLFESSEELRNLLSAAIIAGYSAAAAYELWRGRIESLVSRWPAIVLLGAHAALFLLRTPLTFMPDAAASQAVLSSAWLTVLSPEALLFTIAIAFVLLAMGKERAELGQKTLATTDPLTGLFNRRGFMENAGAVVRQQIARKRPVAVFIVDLDHFKSINDRFGHALGDHALRVFAQVCNGNLRSTDFIGRLGGEEFAVLLADATRDNAFAVAERIRIAFEAAAAVVDGEPLAATISIGVAIIQRPDQDLASLLHQADQALYRAKGCGRNRVELAPVESEGSVEPPAIPIAQPARVRAPR